MDPTAAQAQGDRPSGSFDVENIALPQRKVSGKRRLCQSQLITTCLLITSITAFAAAAVIAIATLYQYPEYFGIIVEAKLDAVIVPCGTPKDGMGWYHAMQFLNYEVPHGNLAYIVEPYYYGAGRKSPRGERFVEWANKTSEIRNVSFYQSIADLPSLPGKFLAVLTSDAKLGATSMPSFEESDTWFYFREVIEAGATHVFFDDASGNFTTMEALSKMKRFADEIDVPVYMDYHKNVANYVRSALNFQHNTEGASLTLIANQAYTEDQLPELFEQSTRVMLSEVAMNELVLLVTYFGVTTTSIASVNVDQKFTRCLKLKGVQNRKRTYTDLSRARFTVTTKAGQSVTLQADLCGVNKGKSMIAFPNSIVVVSVGDEEKFRMETPDEKLKTSIEEQCQTEDDTVRAQFLLKGNDSIVLKERCIEHILAGRSGVPDGVPTIGFVIEALKIADYFTQLLKESSCRKR